MKYVRYVFILLACVISINVEAATSKFEPTINMEPDITENQISVVVGYKGENLMAVTQGIAYEDDYLTLVDVTTMDNFVVTKGQEKKDGDFKTLKLLADSNYAFEDINYAVLTFELKNKFKVGKSSTIFMYSYEAMGPSKDKYRSKGYEMTLRRDDAGQMAFLLKAIDKSTKREYWLSQNYLIIIAIILVIGGIVAAIFLIPTKRRKEARAEKIRQEMSNPKKDEKKEVEPIKIDYSMIEDLGTVKKEVDMSQAIEVSDLKPFGEAESRIVTPPQENTGNTVPSTQIFDGGNIDAFSMSVVSEQPATTNASINTNNVVNNPMDANGNVMINLDNLGTNVAPQVITSQNDGPAIGGEVPTNNQPLEEIPEEKQEDLVLFQPTFDDNQNNANVGNNNGGVPPIMSIVIFLIIALGVSIPETKAIDYRIDDLRNCIVGNIPYDKDLDYNDDGKVDLGDIIATKDLSNTTLKPDEPSHGFKPVESEGVHVTDSTTTTTSSSTSKRGVFNINTTSKRTTTEENKTKSNRTTTKKTTTTRPTTTKRTTTKKTTTTAPTYTVAIGATNGKASQVLLRVQSGKSTSVTVTPDQGYAYESVSCTYGTSVTYNKTSKKLSLKGVKSDDSCKVIFKERTDMKVSISASHGSVSPSSIKGNYKASGTAIVKPSTGYKYKSHSCTNGLKATYDEANNKLTVESLISDGSCRVVFEEKTYLMTINASGINHKFNSKYKQKTDYTIESNKIYKKLKCNNMSKTFDTEEFTSNGQTMYRYKFSYTLTKDITCTYS